MSRKKLDLTRIPVKHAMNKVIEAAGKPRVPSKEELRARRLQIQLNRAKKEEAEMRSVRFLIEQISKDGISSVKELAAHAGCKPGVVEALYKRYPELQDLIKKNAEMPRRMAKRILARQMMAGAETENFDKDVAKVAIDYLKVRGDEDFRGDTGGGGYGGVQVNIVGVSPTAVSATKITPEPELIDNE